MDDALHLLSGFLGVVTAYLAWRVYHRTDRGSMNLDRAPVEREQEWAVIMIGSLLLFAGFFLHMAGGYYHSHILTTLGALATFVFLLMVVWMMHRWEVAMG